MVLRASSSQAKLEKLPEASSLGEGGGGGGRRRMQRPEGGCEGPNLFKELQLCQVFWCGVETEVGQAET